jgi:hypothetical protein
MNRREIAGILLSGIPILHGDLAECFSEARQRLDQEDLSDQELLGHALKQLGFSSAAGPNKSHLN